MSKKNEGKHRDREHRSIRYYPHQRYTCTNCVKCCTRGWDIPVTPAEKARMESLEIPGYDFQSNNYFVPYKSGRLFLLGKDEKNRCVFLGDDGLCDIHREAGEAVKPLACRLYPYDVFNWEDSAISATLRYDCPAVVERCHGGTLGENETRIRAFAQELSKHETKAWASYNGEIECTLDQLRSITEAYQRFLLCGAFSPAARVYAATQLIRFHSDPKNQRDIKNLSPDFSEDAFSFIERSVDDLELVIDNAQPPNLNTRIIFRYLMTGYARTDEEVVSHFLPFGRISRARTILRFIMTNGSLRELGEFYPDTVGLDPLEVMPAATLEDDALPLYWQFLASKLAPMHFCGNPALRLTFEEGMRHLVLTYPICLGFAALIAAAQSRTNITAKDIQEAIMIMDHTFARSPFFALRHVRGMVRRICGEKELPTILHLLPRHPGSHVRADDD